MHPAPALTHPTDTIFHRLVLPKLLIGLTALSHRICRCYGARAKTRQATLKPRAACSFRRRPNAVFPLRSTRAFIVLQNLDSWI